MAIDFESEGLLEGLDGSARAARLELLQRLEADGVGLDELRQAVEEQRLPLLPVERVLQGGGELYTSEEVIGRCGLEREFVERVWRSLGMALAEDGERVFTEADLEAAKRLKALRDAGMKEDDIIELARVMSRGMSGVAVAVNDTFGQTFLEAGDDEHSLAVRYAEASRHLVPMLGPVLEHVLNVQQRSLVRQAAVDTESLEHGQMMGAQEITVCFADLVGFTKLGESVDAVHLGGVAEELERLATDVAEPPVRLIKTIGDEVMLGSPDNDRLLAAAVNLVEAADEAGEGFPQLRAGVARGEALARAGDWYGRPVNLASRITKVARPGSVLVERGAKDAAGEGYRFSFAGERHLRGVRGDVRLYRARRDGEPERTG